MQWFRSYWDEEDIWFYFEVGADDWVIRQVELRGIDRTPIAAASLAESLQARDGGTYAAYAAAYGETAGLPVSQWEGHDVMPLTRDEFEDIWTTARQILEAPHPPEL
ncbi:hypothetical protein [Actinomadura decatromicini]|uniref:Uncharacterized protein n=1 Tax=Actinomadura decatromicini TaxID=2604572 RepID=A0A5D3FGD6_9ACTN|nr:hypothetical protein [Actinomadura decatromicini]TYK47028.1 hypothetical protein FXF68_24765 [Actinomadura decatromicini]